MARAQMSGGIEGSQQGGQQSCRMEALQPESWLACSVHSLQQGHQPSCQRPVRTAPSALMPTCLRAEPAANILSDITDNVVPESTDSHQDGGSGPGVILTSDRLPTPAQHHTSQHPPRDSRENSHPGGAPEWEDEVSETVAHRLRVIGDEINSMFLQRRNAVLPWQNWRGICRGLLLFITNTLCTFYQRRPT